MYRTLPTALGLALALLGPFAAAQRLVGADTVYGHEWIDRSGEYLKIAVTDPGLVAFDADVLIANGWGDVDAAELSLWHFGAEVPLHVPAAGTLAPGDRIAFVHDPAAAIAYEAAQFPGGADGMLSTQQRLVSDTVAYFLRRGGGGRARFEERSGATASFPEAAWTARRQRGFAKAQAFYKKEIDSYSAKYSSFRTGEGWGTAPALESRVRLVAEDAVAGQSGARLHLRTSASFNLGSRVRSVRLASVELRRDTLASTAFSRDDLAVPAAVDLSQGPELEVVGLGSANDKYAVGDVRLEYRAYNRYAGRALRLLADAGAPLGVTGLPDGRAAYVYHVGSRAVYRVDGGDSVAVAIEGLLPGDEVYVASAEGDYPVVVTPWSPPADVDPATEYLVVTSRRTSGWSEGAAAWTAFRQNPRYGGYRTQVVYVEDLYDLYGSGTPNDPQAIRSALSRAADGGRLAHVLLFGKGRRFEDVRHPRQLADPRNATFFCPTYGTPSSDNLLAVHPLRERMLVNVARVAAETTEESAILLEKTRISEDVLADDPELGSRTWVKDVLHITGGTNAAEQNDIQNGMRGMESALAGSAYGPEFTRVAKNASVPVQTGDFDRLFARINEGVGFAAFFGHGSPQTFEIRFDRPDRLRNAGKYPALFAYGCYAGDANFAFETIGERFVFLEDAGFAMFAATTGLGYPFALRGFGTQFYAAFGGEHYGDPVATSLRAAINEGLSEPSYVNRQQAEQFLLQGDPAFVGFKPAGPDVVVDAGSFAVGPAPLVPSVDTFRATVDLRNLGRGFADSFHVVVERQSSLRERVVVDTVAVPGFAQSRRVAIALPSWGPDGGGLNQLWLTVQGVPGEEIMAGALANNRPEPLGFFVADARTRVLYPADGERVTRDSLTFYAEFGRPFDGRQRFEWELSDREDFAAVLERVALESGSLSAWRPSVGLQGGTRYWVRSRTSVDTVWDAVTFTTAAAAERGLDVATATQFAAGESADLSPLPDGSWAFDTLYLNKQFQNVAYGGTERPYLITGFESPYFSMRPWDFTDTAVSLLLVENETGYERFNSGGEYGSIDFKTNQRSFSYHVSTPQERARVVDFIDDVAEDGQIVFFFTVFRQGRDFQPDAWFADSTRAGDRTLIGVLREQGAQRLEEWRDRESVPYTFIFRKGRGPIVESVGDSASAVTYDSFEVPITSGQGAYLSPAIGPFVSASALSWEVAAPPAGEEDALSVELLGLGPEGDTVRLGQSGEYAGAFALPEAARDYGYYAIRVSQTDLTTRTPNPIRRLGVTGALRPELVFDPRIAFGGFVDTVPAEGTPPFELGLRNVSPTPITKPYRLRVTNITSDAEYDADTLASLAPWGTTVWQGSYDLPDERAELSVGLELEASAAEGERFAGNNIAFTQVAREVDATAPALRVLVDGEPLRHRALLAPAPSFRIELRDDLAIDAATVATPELRLTLPDGTVLSGAELPGELRPDSGDGPTELAYRYEPGTLADGVYRLSVRAFDARGNATANSSQQWSFEIANARAISHLLPYPNPMVDRVRFQYELTGEVPSDYQIDIYTSSGRLVRSLGPAELGALQIGRQLTDGAWDGTDAFGQRLARGTYLYRFEVAETASGEAYEARETAAAQYFRSGFGKLVMLR